VIPFLDLQRINAGFEPALGQAVARVLASGSYVLGPEVEAFEAEFAAYCGARHGVGVANGLDALHLILRALDIGAGHEVIVPSHTFIATWLAVNQAGAVPVPVEPDDDGFLIDPARVEAAITPRTRAAIAVHLYGHPAQMTALREVTRRRGLHLIEDAAQAHGARDHGRRVGSLGDAAAFSFYPGKNLGALGDGGAITCDDDALALRLRRMRNYGAVQKYRHDCAGVNSRLDELQAAILRVKLLRLDADNAHRRALAAVYERELRGSPLAPWPVRAGSEPVWHLMVVKHEARDALARALAREDIETGVHYPKACHRQGAYADRAWPALPQAERLAARVLSLPMGPHLTTSDVRVVARCALRACEAVAARALRLERLRLEPSKTQATANSGCSSSQESVPVCSSRCQ
jgi:dTDP-4-amino-4,6-dideoxygalactose transaminase